MKLSKREKILIIILLVAVVGYFTYTYAPIDKLFNIEVLQEEHSQKKHAYDTMSQNIVMKKSFEEKAQTLSAEINDMNVISDLQQENVIVFLNSYFAANNIDVSNIDFTDATVVPMSNIAEPFAAKEASSLEKMINDINGVPTHSGEATEGPVDQQSGNGGQQPSLSARQISASITFESTYSDMLNFMDAIQNNPVDISITNINTLAPGGDILQGIITMNFYHIPKVDGFSETNTEWIWKDLAQFGKINPFSLDGGSLQGVSGGSHDFYMSVVPESSDLPTVMLGKSGDMKKTTYIYADSNSVENISFVFNKENDKYYYRYGTKNSSYPTGGDWEEFSPVNSGSVYVKIYSSLRNSKTDSAGVNISVTNTSGLNIRFDIESDDTTNPRVYFKEPKELVITRK